MAGSAAEIDDYVRKAMFVFGALLVLTVVTVAVSYIDLSVPMAITVALMVATLKGGLVAMIFMHLFAEKKVIYGVLAFTIAFFFVLLFLPILTESDEIEVSSTVEQPGRSVTA